MAFVEGGTFTMGATAEQGTDAGSNESPTHEVTLSSFGTGETPVTQELCPTAICGNPSTASPTWVCVWLCPIWMTRRLRT
ncbi:MAG: SUMF1/EgtB/PvdO family nonheme iron enzyme [Muribaculaceae bacterium]|nr:SUMF1/EgtB/PvdO family nonheme iron enzyme [Muribaculaceae bacterium]